MSEEFEQQVIEAYSYDRRNNITENGVLMVCITLSEYRGLVTAKAKAEQHKSDTENWELRREVDRLRERILEMTTASTIDVEEA